MQNGSTLIPEFTRTRGLAPHDFLVGLISDLSPGFDLPAGVTVKATRFSGELIQIRVDIPRDVTSRSDRPGLIADVYEGFAYLFGKGFYDKNDEGRDEKMVWYATAEHRVAKHIRI